MKTATSKRDVFDEEIGVLIDEKNRFDTEQETKDYEYVCSVNSVRHVTRYISTSWEELHTQARSWEQSEKGSQHLGTRYS